MTRRDPQRGRLRRTGDRKVAGLATRIALSRAALLWERLWPAVWPAFGVAAFFAALSLAGIWQLLDGWIHLGALVAFGLATLGFLWFGLKSLRPPRRDEAQRRLERDSGLPHRPLQAIEDDLTLGGADDQSGALWRTYRRRALASLAKVRVSFPRANLARHDPYAFRAGVGLALFVGFMAAGSEAPSRIIDAFQPDLTSPSPPVEVEAWITPPDYTGRAPVLLDAPFFTTVDGKRQLRVGQAAAPENSTLFVKIHGGKGAPLLEIGADVQAFDPIDGQNHQISRSLPASGKITVLQNEAAVAAWDINIQPDEPPVAVFSDQPTATARLALKIPYLATDDHGVTALRLEMKTFNQDAENIELPLPGYTIKTVRDTAYRDFTPHRWAGLEVLLTLVGEDAAGNVGRSATINIVLPERRFEHPVARAIIEQRRRLAANPALATKVSRALAVIGAFPEEFDHDPVVTLAIRSASRRLILNDNDRSVREVIDMLWDTALRIEDGALSIAERSLRQAEQKLMEALASGAEEAEIDRLTEELRQAMERFLQALAEDLARRAESGEQDFQPFDPDMTMLDSQDLQRMLDRARELSRLGARDAARELLSQLREMLENLRAGTRSARMSPQMREGQRALKELGDLMRRQQKLLDETFRRSQQRGQEGKKGQGRQGAAEQEALRRALGEIMRRLGEVRGDIPGNLGRAERAMRQAGRSLEQGQPGQAVPSQGEALEQLRGGAEELARAMSRERAQGGIAARPGLRRRQLPPGSERTDPLGRPLDNRGQTSDGNTKVPTEAAAQRARRILEELHKRAGELNRPSDERHYLERLLKRF